MQLRSFIILFYKSIICKNIVFDHFLEYLNKRFLYIGFHFIKFPDYLKKHFFILVLFYQICEWNVDNQIRTWDRQQFFEEVDSHDNHNDISLP